jgi:DNA-binding response OmpR family regulator
MEATGQDEPAAEAMVDGDNRPLVAVIDDDADIRAYLVRLLRDSYRVREASDGDSGFQLVRAESPDLVICDVMMPKSGGYEVCKQIRDSEKLSDTPVLMLTAKGGEESKLEGLASGADDYVVKPFHAEMLLARVENLIAIRRMLRRKYSDEIVVKPKDLVVESADGQLLQRVMAVIEEHLGDSEFGVDWLATEVAISPRHLQRKLRQLTNLSAKGLINTMRLKRSAQMLENQAGTVSQIAYWVGFKDAGYFSRLFRQTFGTSPSEHAAAALNRHDPD